MYTLTISTRLADASSDAGDGNAGGINWKSWQGILVVKPGDVEAKTICGAQALPSTRRPLEPPPAPRADHARSTPYSLSVVVEPLVNPAVVRYRLMQRVDASDWDGASPADAVSPADSSLGCLPNGAPAALYRELSVFNVSGKKGSRKDYQKTVCDLVPGRVYSFLTIAEAEHGAVCSEEGQLRPCSAPPLAPPAPTLAKRDKKELKVKWEAPDARGAAISQYEVALALEATHAQDMPPCDMAEAEVIFAGGGGQLEMPVCTRIVCSGGGGGSSSSETSAVLKGLIAGARYLVRVRACNAEGWSDWGSSAVLTTAAGASEAPAAPRATVTHGGIHLSWLPPSHDNGARVTGACCTRS